MGSLESLNAYKSATSEQQEEIEYRLFIVFILGYFCFVNL